MLDNRSFECPVCGALIGTKGYCNGGIDAGLDWKHARLDADTAALFAAAERVLDGLDARISAAPSNAVPVFDGIADLHDALHEIAAPVRG